MGFLFHLKNEVAVSLLVIWLSSVRARTSELMIVDKITCQATSRRDRAWSTYSN